MSDDDDDRTLACCGGLEGFAHAPDCPVLLDLRASLSVIDPTRFVTLAGM